MLTRIFAIHRLSVHPSISPSFLFFLFLLSFPFPFVFFFLFFPIPAIGLRTWRPERRIRTQSCSFNKGEQSDSSQLSRGLIMELWIASRLNLMRFPCKPNGKRRGPINASVIRLRYFLGFLRIAISSRNRFRSTDLSLDNTRCFNCPSIVE